MGGVAGGSSARDPDANSVAVALSHTCFATSHPGRSATASPGTMVAPMPSATAITASVTQ